MFVLIVETTFKFFLNKHSNVGIHFRENKQCLGALYSCDEQLNFDLFAGLLSNFCYRITLF